MDAVRMSTVVYVPPEDVYEFLTDFEGYGRYSEHINRIEVDGDGGVGTEYGIEFSWWKLSYLARSRVVGLDPPNRIAWEVTKDIDASGTWLIEPVAGGDEDDGNEGTEAGEETGERPATRVTIEVRFDSDSVGSDVVDLPWFVNLGWVVEKVTPLIAEQARTVLRRVVADLEGEPRNPELVVERVPESVDVDEDDLDVTS